MNNTDKPYQDLLKRILDEGKLRWDRTGTGTISIFSHTLEMDMADGFPLLTTKKMFTKGIIHELLWFLKGDTNIQYLVKNGVNIWTPDAYREYKNYAGKLEEPDYDVHIDNPNENRVRLMTIEEFGDRIKTDDKFAKTYGKLGPVYGKQWVNWGVVDRVPSGWHHGAPTGYKDIGINQIQQAIDTLNNNPESRRIMVSAWNVGEISEMALPPCHWAFELYTEELTLEERFKIKYPDGSFYAFFNNPIYPYKTAHDYLNSDNTPTRRLSLKWHQRSVDTFLGLPFNIASYGFLLHMLAQQTNMVVGTLIGDLTNVHIYKNHIDQCKEQIGREPFALAKLELKKGKDIFSYSYDDFKIDNYISHDSIKGEISV